MRAISALAFLAALGLILAGCGSGTKAGSGPITVNGTTTISSVKTGTLVSCRDGPAGAKVPPAGQGVTANVDGSRPSSSGELQLTHRQDGSLVAACSGFGS